MKRSGNHAVINWLCKQHNTEHIFINAVLPFQDPFLFTKEARRNTSLLVYSYEDSPLVYLCDPAFEKAIRSRYDIAAGQTFCILLLREPLNLFASRCQSKYLGVASRILNDTDLWIMHARAYLESRKSTEKKWVCINYDEWFSSKTYRQEIAHALGLAFSDTGRDEVPHFGGGSSFDALNYQTNASQMNVLERWKSFRGDPCFENYIGNSELLRLAQLIFSYDEECLAYIRSLQSLSSIWRGLISKLKICIIFPILRFRRRIRFLVRHQ